MIYVGFAVWLIKGFSFLKLKETIKENRLLFWAFFLSLFGVGLATIHSWDLGLSAGILKAWFFDPLLFFIVFVSIIKSLDDIKKVFYSFIMSGFVVSVVSLIYLFLGKTNIDGRLQGFYDSPNYLAMYLAPVFIVVFCFLAQIIYTKTRVGVPASRRAPSRPRLDRALGLRMVFLINNLRPTFLILSFSFLILVLFFTKSFGAWMGIIGAIGLGLIFWLWGVKKKKTVVVLAILLIILCIGIYFIKFNSIQGKLSINSRLEIWQRAMDAVVMYPIIGIGPGTFKDFFPSYPFWGVPQPHNLYLAFLLQTGIIGFVGFVLLLVWFFKTGFKQLAVHNPELTTYCLLLLSLMIYILIHGLVDTTYWKNDLSLVFWTIIGIMAITKNQLKTKNEKVKTVIQN
ncbi:MAG: O-antigen ligase family protein [bacterium]|nr:O-antigen ligase family protein [bacterium]